jgi:hypothetical protein
MKNGGRSVAPGAKLTVALAEPLASGRYALVCFLPDTDEGEEGTPHAFKGMLAEFTKSQVATR